MLNYVTISQINIAEYQNLISKMITMLLGSQILGEKKNWKITKAAHLYSMIPGSRKWVSKSPSSITSGGFPWLNKGQDWLEHLHGVSMLISYMDSEALLYPVNKGEAIRSFMNFLIVCGQNSHKLAKIEEEIWFPNLMVALLVDFGHDNKLP